MSETLETMLEAMPDSYQKTVGFPTYDLLAAAAIPMDAFAQQLSDTERKLDPEELTGAELDSYILSRSGLERNPATYAEGVLLVTGNGTVQAGDLFESGGGVQFVSTQTVEIIGSGEVPVRCVTPGAVGNLPAGSITMTAHLHDGLLAGEISLYHGYEEANANELIPADLLDPYTGFPAYKQFPCRLTRVEE